MNKGIGLYVSLCVGLCLISILFVGPVDAAAADRPVGQAIQFRIVDGLALREFEGATLGYLHYRGHDAAWRATLDLNMSYDDQELRVDLRDGMDAADVSHDRTRWNQNFGVGIDYLWFRGEAVSAFFGGGPHASFRSSHQEYWGYDLNNENWARELLEDNDFGAGVRGCLGVQWAATRWLAIHADYEAEVMYHRRVSKDLWENFGSGDHANGTVATNNISLSSLGVRFGLSAYF